MTKTNEILEGLHQTIENMRNAGIEVSDKLIAHTELLIAMTTSEDFNKAFTNKIHEEVEKRIKEEK